VKERKKVKKIDLLPVSPILNNIMEEE